MRFFFLSVFLFSAILCAQIIDYTPPTDELPAAGDGTPEKAVAVIRSGVDTTDTTRINADSMTYEFLGLNEHIGPNGVALLFSFVNQVYAGNTSIQKARSFGTVLSGDILTGLSFIHLIPALHYWSYSENVTTGFLTKQTYRDAGLSMHAVFMSPRLTKRKFRFYGGGGPSFHLSMLTQSDDAGNSETTPGFKNGFSLLGGAEFPLNGVTTFITNVMYKQIYDWSTPYRNYFFFSVGFAV